LAKVGLRQEGFIGKLIGEFEVVQVKVVEIIQGPKRACFNIFNGKVVDLEIDLEIYLWQDGKLFLSFTSTLR
jgi:hypothetical protein